MISLPTVPSCTEPPCGLCCETQSSPPGYAIYFPPPGHEVYPWALNEEEYPDAVLWRQVPEQLKDELAIYYNNARRLAESGAPSLVAYRDGEPCLWYDTVAKRCKHYEYRPSTCRDFEPGEVACLEYRRRGGLS